MQAIKADPSLLQSARNTEVGERFNRTLFAALDALQEGGIDYALIGGVASSGLGRPRSTHDIDIFVRPEDSGGALDALTRKGFVTEKTDTAWLFKGWKEDILVDIIFKSRGDIYFDSEMSKRARPVEYHGRQLRAVAPEDLIIIKAAVHDEIGPHHWHDALAILSHATLDWEYLLKRARRAPRRLLALLLYAQANDIWVPNHVVFELFKNIFGDVGAAAIANPSAARNVTAQKPPNEPIVRRMPDAYVVARVKEALAQDPRTGEQDIKLMVDANRILLRGEMASEEHRRATEAVVREAAPGYQIDNQIKVPQLPGPEGVEDVG